MERASLRKADGHVIVNFFRMVLPRSMVLVDHTQTKAHLHALIELCGRRWENPNFLIIIHMRFSFLLTVHLIIITRWTVKIEGFISYKVRPTIRTVEIVVYLFQHFFLLFLETIQGCMCEVCVMRMGYMSGGRVDVMSMRK